MATTTKEKMDVGFLEKLGDGLSAFSESVVSFLGRVFGSSNERTVRKLGYIRLKDADPPYRIVPGSLLAQVNALEDKYKAMTDADLKGTTAVLKARLAQGETLDDILPDAFAACREAGRRFKNMRHFDVQIVGGIVLHRGNIAEMVTGEGKTLVATLPAYLNCLEGKGVHVVTVNDYLARRDCEWMLPIYQALGVSAGYIQSEIDASRRRQAYECDITYGTSSEFGFDYLRDNMKPARWGDERFHAQSQQVQRGLHFAVIDEVDNILIDEARTPLIISGPAFSDVRRYELADAIAVQLGELEKKARAEGRLDQINAELRAEHEKGSSGFKAAADVLAMAALAPGKSAVAEERLGVYFEVKEKEHTCHLTDEGVRKAEELAGVESFYTTGNMEWPHLIDNALRAHHLYKRDRDYMVAEHEGERKIIIIDTNTGRALFGRQWSDGLHQAVEAKHKRDGVQIKQETQTLATVTLQNYFRMYKKLSGMTGTAMTEANEFWKIYKLDVISIPTNRALKRVNSPDVIYRTETEKWMAVMEEIVAVHASGRPILIGTTDVAKSEKLSAMLRRRGIKHELLNAKPENVARESEIVAQAGRLNAVTISTNMAGRGTDIILGGNPETMAWAKLKPNYPTRLDIPEDVWKKTVDDIEAKEKMKEEGQRVIGLGGLHIVGTERHDSRRIDNQLRGRAGRQGDPGSSRFFLSLEDDLLRKFGGDWVKKVLSWMGMKEGEAIEDRMVTRQVGRAQKKVEEQHFDMRKNLLEYDEVMDVQRKRVYGERQKLLNDGNPKMMLLEFIDAQVAAAVKLYMDFDFGPSSFAEFVANRLPVALESDNYTASDFRGSDFDLACDTALTKARRHIETAIHDAMDENLSADEDPKEWKWQEMARAMNARYNLKLTDRQLKQIGRDNLAAFLIEEAEKAIAEVDLTPGKKYLQSDWGRLALVDWMRQKFQIRMAPEEVVGLTESAVRKLLLDKIMAVYRQKEIAFPVQVAVATYMAERPGADGRVTQRYDRQGLLEWAKKRFGPPAVASLNLEEFHTGPRSKVFELLLKVAENAMPKAGTEDIDAKLREELVGAKLSEADDARSLIQWMRTTFNVDVQPERLTGVPFDEARRVLWNAYDDQYRPEMHRMERGLLLARLDNAWKLHLLQMDRLRQSVNLRGYAQQDPKSEYKREGMNEFAAMWTALQDKVTDAVFKMEEEPDFEDSIWAGATATRPVVSDEPAPLPTQEPQTTNSTEAPKKVEPIRNKGEKVGRNDPCPCGSGKKYKNCHMRNATPRK